MPACPHALMPACPHALMLSCSYTPWHTGPRMTLSLSVLVLVFGAAGLSIKREERWWSRPRGSPDTLSAAKPDSCSHDFMLSSDPAIPLSCSHALMPTLGPEEGSGWFRAFRRGWPCAACSSSRAQRSFWGHKSSPVIVITRWRGDHQFNPFLSKRFNQPWHNVPAERRGPEEERASRSRVRVGACGVTLSCSHAPMRLAQVCGGYALMLSCPHTPGTGVRRA